MNALTNENIKNVMEVVLQSCHLSISKTVEGFGRDLKCICLISVESLELRRVLAGYVPITQMFFKNSLNLLYGANSEHTFIYLVPSLLPVQIFFFQCNVPD